MAANTYIVHLCAFSVLSHKKGPMQCQRWPAQGFDLCFLQAGRQSGKKRIPRGKDDAVDVAVCRSYKGLDFWVSAASY